MFSKVSKTMAPPAESPKTSNKNLAPTIISADLRIVGDIIGSGDIQVDGNVEGDIHSRSITVGENASVRGSLTADSVRVYGVVEGGTIKAMTVSVSKTARVMSNIIHQTLTIETGAYVEGDIKRMEGADPKMAMVRDKPDAPGLSSAGIQPLSGLQAIGRK